MYGKAFTTICAAIIGFSAIMTMPTASFADGITITGGGFYSNNRNDDDANRHTDQLGGKLPDKKPRRLRCEIGLAKEKARSYGFRFAEVASISERTIVIAGRLDKRWRQIAFANHYGCPVIDR